MREEKFNDFRAKRNQQNKTLLAFWFFAIILLAGWFVFLQIRTKGYPIVISHLKPIVRFLPIKEYQKEELKTILTILPGVLNEKEKTLLLVFQDSNELRPGGGLIEAFGILKIQNESIISFDVHDVSKFDAGKDSGMTPPHPIGDLLGVSNWKLQDSNWSADFSTNVKNMQKLYGVQGGEEVFDGVVSFSSELISSVLEATGPVMVEGYEGEYNSKNLSSKMQYYKEKGQIDDALKALLVELLGEIQESNWNQKKLVFQKIEESFIQKEVITSLGDENLQQEIERLGWGGSIKQEKNDYLMVVDANLGSLKTDRFINRTFEYTVDFSADRPRAKFDLKYQHNGRVRDWQTSDYTSYLRLYIPKEGWLIESEGVGNIKFGEEEGKRYFGTVVDVPLGGEKEVSFSYYLPESAAIDDYELFIQKQPGIKEIKGKINIIQEAGDKISYGIVSKRDRRLKP